jgi:hypothetical protein
MTSHYIILTVAIIYQDKKGIPNRYALQLSLRDKETIGEASELSIKIDNQEISLQKSFIDKFLYRCLRNVCHLTRDQRG